MNALKNVLIINPFGIGDVLFTTPLVRAIKDNYPQARIGFLCNSRSREALIDNPCLDKIFVYDRDDFEIVRRKSFWAWINKSRKFIDEIRKSGFDAAIDLSLNSQYGFICWLAGIKRRFGYDYKKRGYFLTKKIKLNGYSNKHVMEYYADLLKYLNLDMRLPKTELYINANKLLDANKVLKTHGVEDGDSLVGIIPGGGRSWGKDAYLKHWPAERFAGLADKIIDNYKAKIIILGDFSEQKISRQLLANMKHKAIDLTGQTSIRELTALLSRMSLIICNDGGPLHMAGALGLKTVSIFGPVDEKVYGPYPPRKESVVVKKQLDCRPCYKNFRYSGCSNNHRCINDIMIDEVFEQVRRLI
ncbi:MAG: lipopolysaccharide heptosyltransferase II [Candidatus Omnitrophota bacterium]